MALSNEPVCEGQAYQRINDNDFFFQPRCGGGVANNAFSISWKANGVGEDTFADKCSVRAMVKVTQQCGAPPKIVEKIVLK